MLMKSVNAVAIIARRAIRIASPNPRHQVRPTLFLRAPIPNFRCPLDLQGPWQPLTQLVQIRVSQNRANKTSRNSCYLSQWLITGSLWRRCLIIFITVNIATFLAPHIFQRVLKVFGKVEGLNLAVWWSVDVRMLLLIGGRRHAIMSADTVAGIVTWWTWNEVINLTSGRTQPRIPRLGNDP